MAHFRYGKDDHSARELIMKFGTPCYNADIDALQYGFDDNGDIQWFALLELKHPCLKELTIDTIKVQRALAKQLAVPLFVPIYFTKPAPESGPCPPGDGYGTAEQPAMFYVVPGNKQAADALKQYNNGNMWMTPLAFARFMHWIRGSNRAYLDMINDGLTDDYKQYKASVKVDFAGLSEAFRNETRNPIELL